MKYFSSILLLGCLGTSVGFCQKPPQLLAQAVRCLDAKQFLPPSSAATLTFGYWLDEKSYPGEKVIYLVKYASPSKSNGWVFAIFLTTLDGVQHFNIQNNASFVLSKDHYDYDGVSFADPPLGGTWTQEHLASAIQKIEQQQRFTISASDISPMIQPEGCLAYTDRQ